MHKVMLPLHWPTSEDLTYQLKQLTTRTTRSALSLNQQPLARIQSTCSSLTRKYRAVRTRYELNRALMLDVSSFKDSKTVRGTVTCFVSNCAVVVVTRSLRFFSFRFYAADTGICANWDFYCRDDLSLVTKITYGFSTMCSSYNVSSVWRKRSSLALRMINIRF